MYTDRHIAAVMLMEMYNVDPKHIVTSYSDIFDAISVNEPPLLHHSMNEQIEPEMQVNN